MNSNTVFKIIDDLYPEYIKIWEDVCNIESPTNYKEGVDKVLKYFCDMAASRGWKVEISKQDVAGDAGCITMNPDIKESPICFSGHMDTVHPVGLFGYPPVKKDDKNIYGPGVVDCKGGLVSSFLAMDALCKAGYKKRPVKLILQSDEETSSKTSGLKTVEFMKKMAKGAIAFLNTEPFGRYEAVLETKGILRFRINIKGVAKHSSICYKGASAILEASHKIIELEKMKNPDGLTFSCGVIEGGTASNTVPENCSFIVDIRFKNNEQKKKAIGIIKEITEKTWVDRCTSELEEISIRPAMEYSDKNKELLEKLNEIYKDCDLTVLEPINVNGGSDAAFITEADIPCIDGFGPFGKNLHSIEEYGEMESLKTSAKYLAAASLGL